MTLAKGLDIRTEVLSEALYLEALVSGFLAGLLGIKNIPNSKVLGNKSNPISFNQKILLLIEIGALDENTFKKYQMFMEVRNQFMHNFDASSYEKCFEITKSDAQILKAYPQNASLSKEEQLYGAFTRLTEEIKLVTNTLILNLREKSIKILQADAFEYIAPSMKQTRYFIENYIQEAIAKNKTVKDIESLGILAEQNYLQYWKDYADKVDMNLKKNNHLANEKIDNDEYFPPNVEFSFMQDYRMWKSLSQKEKEERLMDIKVIFAVGKDLLKKEMINKGFLPGSKIIDITYFTGLSEFGSTISSFLIQNEAGGEIRELTININLEKMEMVATSNSYHSSGKERYFYLKGKRELFGI